MTAFMKVISAFVSTFLFCRLSFFDVEVELLMSKVELKEYFSVFVSKKSGVLHTYIYLDLGLRQDNGRNV